MIEITKPIKHLPLFMIINYKAMVPAAYRQRMNLIILNNNKVDALISKLSEDKERSRKFLYWIAFLDKRECIEEMYRLTDWMIANKMGFAVTADQLKMYYKTMNDIHMI